MARRKKDAEEVTIDEVREEMAQTPAEGEEVAESSDQAEPMEAEGEIDPDDQESEEGGSEEAEVPDGEGGESESAVEAEGVADPGDKIKSVSDCMLLSVELSDHEMVEQTRIMIEALDEAKSAKVRAKAFASECKAEEEQAMQRFDEAKAVVRRGKEERQVEVEQIHNWTREKVYTRRKDTGEIIQVRVMQPYERQMTIDDEVKGEEAPIVDEDQLEDPEDIDTEGADLDDEEEGELAAVGVDEAEAEG